MELIINLVSLIFLSTYRCKEQFEFIICNRKKNHIFIAFQNVKPGNFDLQASKLNIFLVQFHFHHLVWTCLANINGSIGGDTNAVSIMDVLKNNM